jgi:hypothetical protein
VSTDSSEQPEPSKVDRQIAKAGLPTNGTIPFVPQLDLNRRRDEVIRRETVQHGLKKGKKGYVDTTGRIWVKCRAHGHVPDHWDVQLEGGADYVRVGLDGNELP